jgi:hypothetical protein
MAIWLRGLERWYLVLGGVAVGRGFEHQSDLELSFAEILLYYLFNRTSFNVSRWSAVQRSSG